MGHFLEQATVFSVILKNIEIVYLATKPCFLFLLPLILTKQVIIETVTYNGNGKIWILYFS